jgi:hypothetical protein
MAGYDFEAVVTDNLLLDARALMHFFQRAAAQSGLRVTYRTRRISRPSPSIYVTVDGPLPAMQHLHRELARTLGMVWVLGRSRPSAAMQSLALFLRANAAGLKGITEMVFRTAADFRAQPAPLSVSVALNKAALQQRHRRQEYRAGQRLLGALDAMVAGRSSPEDTLILCDQVVEGWLRHKLGTSVPPRAHHPVLLQEALGQKIISRGAGARLRRYHRARNNVQHRGGRTRRSTVLNMIDVAIRVMEQRS